jgi:hypothetical protein
MVEGIEFDGPVSETLRQTQALWQNYLNRIKKGVLLYNKTPIYGTYQVLSTQGITLEKAT